MVTPKARAKHEPFVQQTGLRILTFKCLPYVGLLNILVGLKQDNKM